MRNAVLAILIILALFLSGILFLLVLWRLLNRGQKEAPASLEIGNVVLIDAENLALPKVEDAVAPEAGAGADETTKVSSGEAPAQPVPDDLTRIEGIGPKIAGVLQAASVLTYAQLAETDVTRLEEILETESPRLRWLADPSTWSEQAALAARGNWEALQELQGTFKRGRRSG